MTSDFLPAHSASFAHNFVSGCNVLFQNVPGYNGITDLSRKIVFWTHNFEVGLIDMGNSESHHKHKIVNESLNEMFLLDHNAAV